MILDILLVRPSLDAISNYNDIFGNFFIEFYEYDVPCAYIEAGNEDFDAKHRPILVYMLNNSYYSDMEYYIYEIIYRGDPYYSDIVGFSGAADYGFIYPPFAFPHSGYYTVTLYNVSSNGSRDGLVYTSTRMLVCGDIYNDEYVSDYSQYIVIGGFISLLGLAVVIAIYTGQWLSFPFVIFGGMIMFSIPGTFLSIFPPLLLFIGGLVLVLTILVIYIRR